MTETLTLTMPPRIEGKHLRSAVLLFDPWLAFAVLSLVLLGLVMVASSSIVISLQQFHAAFHYLLRQLIFLGLGLFLAIFIVQTPLRVWQGLSWLLLPISVGLLSLVLIPGVGHEINGSTVSYTHLR